MNKNGLAVSVIVVMIIIVIGFAILLIFYSQIAWTGNIDRSVCHQSVVYRATLPEFANSKDFVPLKCRTEKICITSSFLGKCKEYEGAKGVTRIKVDNVKDIEKIISQEILSCWETMGEGKLSLFNDFLAKSLALRSIKSSCVVCSRISFDDENLEKSKIDKDKSDVFKYMISHKVPNEEISYYEKILGDKGNLNIKNEINSKTSDEIAVVFSQILAPDNLNILTRVLSGLGLGLLTPYQVSFSIIENNIIAGYCGDVKVGGDAKKGCSVVRTMNYNANDISQFCGKIESIS
ncbi:MAG: hypothetical protein AABW83_01565 [Nanoarchaeota archaeon]